MINDKTTIQFCGFGGQGIVLSSVIFGTALVKFGGFNAVQTSSYGSEARGGECQAELIVSRKPILSPLSDHVNILLAMSQLALNQYIDRLKPGQTLIIDPDMVKRPSRSDISILEVPATKIANDRGLRIAANMVMLGFLQKTTGLINAEALITTVKENVPQKFEVLNLEMVNKGIALAGDIKILIEE